MKCGHSCNLYYQNLDLNSATVKGLTHDSTLAQHLASEKCDHLLADKAYDSDDFRKFLAANEVEAVIPGRKNRNDPIIYDKDLHRERNIVERFFCKLKHFRRIATRYEKLDFMFRGMLILGCMFVWLRA